MAKSYSKKARGIVISAQAVEGVPTVIGSVLPADSIACFEPTYDTEISSDTLEYAGDEFSRDIRTDITDRVLGCSFTTLVPALGVPAAAPGITNFPLETLFESTGATVTYSGTAGTSKVKVSNDVVSSNQVTVMVAAVSADDPTLQKVYRGFDGNTTVDLEMEIDKRAKLKWSPKAIPVDDAATPEVFPQEITKIVPDYSNQKDLNLPTLSAKNLTQAELVVFGSKGYGTGTLDLPAPFAGTVKNFCFSKITAANLFGFTWERLHNSCQTGFEKLVATPDVVITILEDDLSATLIPDRNVTAGGMLEGYFAFALEYGKVAGKTFYLTFDKLQCVNVKNTEVGSRSAKELTFKNCSHTTLYWNAAA